MGVDKLEVFIEALDRRLERLETKVDLTIVTNERQNALLDEHMRRTEAVEEQTELVRKEIAPLKTHVAAWGVIGKVIGATGTLAGVATAAGKLFGWF